jgi:RHS repeat-associated protein
VVWLHGDHLGSTSLATSEGPSPTVVGRQLYAPFGEVRWTSGALGTDFGFTGQRADGYIGLVHMGARWYNVKVGRWVSADTIVPDPGDPQDFNRYTYSRNNALKYVDPSGYDCVTVDGEIRCSDQIPATNEYWDSMTPEQQNLAAAAFLRFLEDPDYFLYLYLNDNRNRDLMYLNSWAQNRERKQVEVLLGIDPNVTFEQIDQAVRLAASGDIDAEEFLWRVSPALAFSMLEHGSQLMGAASATIKWGFGKIRSVLGRGGGLSAPPSTQAVHGNSLASSKPTWLYKLVDRNTGQVMKYGITSSTNPQWRYTKQWYTANNVDLVRVAQGQRWHMYQLEYQLNVQNNSPWSKYGH